MDVSKRSPPSHLQFQLTTCSFRGLETCLPACPEPQTTTKHGKKKPRKMVGRIGNMLLSTWNLPFFLNKNLLGKKHEPTKTGDLMKVDGWSVKVKAKRFSELNELRIYSLVENKGIEKGIKGRRGQWLKGHAKMIWWRIYCYPGNDPHRIVDKESSGFWNCHCGCF